MALEAVDEPANVTDLIAEPGSCEVTLRWNLPAGCTLVDVQYAVGEVPQRGEGVGVLVSGYSVSLGGMQSGVEMGFRVLACYGDPEDRSRILRASGVGVVATPT